MAYGYPSSGAARTSAYVVRSSGGFVVLGVRPRMAGLHEGLCDFGASLAQARDVLTRAQDQTLSVGGETWLH